jgi:hypothetical protein
MGEAEYVALIPQPELQQLDALLSRVYERRGFGSSSSHLRLAWDALLLAARDAGWAEDLSADELADEGLQQLGQLVDAHFFGGRLHARLGACRRGGLRYRVAQTSEWGDDWIAFFHVDNVLYINRRVRPPRPTPRPHASAQPQGASLVHGLQLCRRAGAEDRACARRPGRGSYSTRPARAAGRGLTLAAASGCFYAQRRSGGGGSRRSTGPSPAAPLPPPLRSKWRRPIGPGRAMSCEGVLCTSRLQVLCHTLAHELVHAIIFNVFPRIDRRSPAYLPCDRHGPIFHYMNKRLFGHTSDSYTYVSHRVGALP